MPGPDPSHWLHRLTAAEWLAAAETELAAGDAALVRRSTRVVVTHARRAAGMALNAILCLRDNPAWGRSYMEHVVALAGDPAAPAERQADAALLRDTPPAPPTLVKLGPPDRSSLDAAERILAWARATVSSSTTTQNQP